MKWLKYLKFLCLVGLTSSLIYCGTQPAPKDPGLGRGDDYYDQRNRREGRDDALERAKKKYTGPRCEGDEDCEDICKDIYRHSVRDECEELAIEQVEILEQIDEIFENPKERELKDIDAFDFETYVNIDLAPFDKRVGRFSSSEAKRVLAWMVENSDVLELFISVDDEYNLLEDMLNDLSSNSDQKALTISVSGSDSLIEIAVDKEEDVLEWLHEYFGEKCSNDDEQEVCVLQKWYCEFNLKRDHWDALVGYESFEDDIANEILSSYCTAASDTAESCENTATDPFVPGNGSPDWWTDEVENIGDLNEPQDLEDLCDKHLVRR